MQHDFHYCTYPLLKPNRMSAPLQTEVEKDIWVDPQDAFRNYRLLTAGRECFVVSCIWLLSMMLPRCSGWTALQEEAISCRVVSCYAQGCSCLPAVCGHTRYLCSLCKESSQALFFGAQAKISTQQFIILLPQSLVAITDALPVHSVY